MNEICIHVPSLGEDQTVEVEVTVNGKTRLMNYRVKSFDWTLGGTDPERRIDRLRSMINSYDPQWELVQIGSPDGHLVPVMFRQRVQNTS
ncbi:MAG: hypothetical protein O6942_09200 [Bacteroidetes bacterium]|nr:hypothetical protein [Bacteroidota bacterium]MCZ6758012.1 hypothetical protein [Bacteroidota bacterium]